METINILWTGGWDSTFRVIELSREEVKIQPYYVLDNTRNSQKNELETIKNISEKLRHHENTKAEILPIKLIEIESIEKDEEITQIYNKMHKKYKIGSQYDYLARLALKIDNLEIGLENEPSSKALNFINRCGALKKTRIKGMDTYVIDAEKSKFELIKLFGNLNFPIIDKSKMKMKEIAEKMGYGEIMNMTWFCHNPINNEPCGFCNPCISTIRSGFRYRFPENSLKRYKRRKIDRIVRIVKKVSRKIFNKVA